MFSSFSPHHAPSHDFEPRLIHSQQQPVSSAMNMNSNRPFSLCSSCYASDNLLLPNEGQSHKEWHSRGYLPHFDHPGMIQAITFRLFDSVPKRVIDQWRVQLKIAEHESADNHQYHILYSRIEKYSDLCEGACWLNNPKIAKFMQETLLHFDNQRYKLLAWCIMPNHIHALIKTIENFLLGNIIHSWKSFSAKKINEMLNRRGKVWMPEYHDRYIRNEEHYRAMEKYIAENPVKAGLCQNPEDWQWSHRRRLA